MVAIGQAITQNRLYSVAYEANKRAAIAVPQDGIEAFEQAFRRETKPMASFILGQVLENAQLAIAEERPMCGDTGLPRYYVKVGNEANIEGGFVALEHTLRRAVADVTQDVQLRANRVHPLTRQNPGNNVGVFAPSVDYSFEPDADWIDVTAVHKGGLFGTDYRMLFPADGTDGIKRFLLDNLAAFARRGLSCPPVVVGVGLGGSKDQSVVLSKGGGLPAHDGRPAPRPGGGGARGRAEGSREPHGLWRDGRGRRHDRARRSRGDCLHPHRGAAHSHIPVLPRVPQVDGARVRRRQRRVSRRPALVHTLLPPRRPRVAEGV